VISVFSLSAAIINIPANQPTIQVGINVAVDGDTVLVQPGTYVENINCNGKEITVASLFLTTQDTTYISQTIIDGNQTGNVIRFENMENNNTVLTGFTITNGLSQDQGGGIRCNHTSPILDHLKIINNHSETTAGGVYCNYSFPIISNTIIFNNYSHGSGGGIACYYSSPTLSNVKISYNEMYGNHGAGIACYDDSNPTLTNVEISHNSGCSYGGGLYCLDDSCPQLYDVVIANNSAYFCGGGISTNRNSNLYLENVLITGNYCGDRGGGIHISDDSHHVLTNVVIQNNTALDKGGGIICNGQLDLTNVTISHNNAYEGGGMYVDSHNVNFDAVDRCNIYCNYAYFGSDLCGSYYNPVNINVIVDTFTVQNPTAVQVYPLEDFTFDILNGYYSFIYNDVYVSPDGADTNDGLSWDSPLKTITCALTRIQTSITEPHTIFLSSGTFSPDTNQEIFPLLCVSNLNLIGMGQTETQLIGDGEDVILFLSEKENVTIEGMTISSGTQGLHIEDCSDINLESLTVKDNFIDEYQSHGGGIYCCACSSVLFNNLLIEDNHSSYGAGISLSGLTNVAVNNCIIRNNQAEYGGGGLSTTVGTFNLNNLQIYGNRAEYGGGLFGKYLSIIFLENVSIHDNVARNAGGIYGQGDGVEFNFSENANCNLYRNHATIANDICFSHIDPQDIIVDTFTVATPTRFHAYPVEEISFDIQNPLFDQVNCDLFVSPDGDDNNSGLSSYEPLKTIYAACAKVLSDSLNPNTIFLDEGTYSLETNGEILPVCMAEDYLTLQGNEENQTILDGGGTANLITVYMVENCIINDLILQNGYDEYGAAIHASSSSLSINRVKCQNNYAHHSGSAISGGNDLRLDNVCCVNNASGDNEGALYINGYTLLLNSTISDNNSGEAIVLTSGELIVINSILREESINQIFSDYGQIAVSHSNILGGESAVTGYETMVVWLDGNLDEDPIFSWRYYLPENSPCVDAGTTYFEWSSQVLLDMQPDEYYGSAPDMGAYEYGFVDIGENTIEPNYNCVLHQNFPNPFNPSTTISFNLTAKSAKDAKIEIYNIKGQKVKTFSNRQITNSPNQQIIWNGDDENGKSVASGIYFYKLKVRNETKAVRKCLLLK